MDEKHFSEIEGNLNATEDGEASEEPKGASKDPKLILEAVLDISFNHVIGRRVKVDVKDVQPSVLLFSNLKTHFRNCNIHNNLWKVSKTY